MHEERRPGEFEPRSLGKSQYYGVASVTNALQGLEFPISKQELIHQFGNKTIQWTKDNPQALRDILGKVTQEKFHSIADIAAAVGNAVKGRVPEHR